MRRLVKKIMALCLTICLLPFADYSTALAAGNTGIANETGIDNAEEGDGSLNGTRENGSNKSRKEDDENNDIEPFTISENDGGGNGMLPEAVEADRAGESVDCNMQIQVQIDKKGYVALNWQEYKEGAAAYRIYRNELLIAETEETEFQDKELERKAAYTYRLVVLDEEGQEIAQDCSIQIELPDNYQVEYDNSLVLKEDMIVYNLDVYGELDLNGHSLTVLNCADLSGSSISFHGGSLLVNHDVRIECSQYKMNAEEDYLYAGGNVEWKIWASHYYEQVIELEKGTIEIKGDFLAGETDTFLASEDFYTIFSGEEKQTIELYDGDASFGRVELANSSEEGVYAKEPFLCSELIQNDTKLVIGADEVKSGFELEEDMIVEGDFCLGGGTLDLSGHTLTVQGNLIQTGGTVFVNGGKLIIEKDYRIQSRTYNEDEGSLEEYAYGKSTGILNMTMDGDEVLIQGGFYTNSRMDHQGFLTKGAMEVKGDFYEYTDSSLGNFIATDEHKVILSGEGKQTVSFGINRASASRFSNLELQNTSEEGIVFVNRPYAAGEISGNESHIEGAITAGNKTVFQNQYYGGDIYLTGNFAIREPVTFGGDVTVSSYLTLYDRMMVEGNVTILKNCVTFAGGEMIVKKNFSVQGGNGNYGIKMTNEADRLSIYGDFYYDAAGSMSKSAGTIEVKGNVEIVRGFMAEGFHVFLLNGDGKQEVTMKEGNAFCELWVENYSEDGIHVLTDIAFESIKENGCNITYFSGMLLKDEVVDGDYELNAENFNFNGKQMTVKGNFVQSQGILKLNKGKLVVEGDFILTEGTVQMKGGNITVKGSLIQEGGTIQVENGSLIVEGDYRIQKRSGQEDAYNYGVSNGLLEMTKEGGKVLVNGDFHTASTMNHTDYFTNGTLEIKGDLIQATGGNEYNLVFSKEHLLLLSGTGKQCVDFLPVKLEKPDSYIYYQGKSCIANLEITNQSKEGIEFLNKPVVNGRIKDNHNRIEGVISIIKNNNIVFEDGYYGGDVDLWCNILSYKSLYIAGDLQIHSGLLLRDNLEIEGDCDVIEGSIDVGIRCMSVGGNLSIKNTAYGLYFSGNGKVVVSGNLDYLPAAYRDGYLKKGTLEIKGDAVFNGNFRASGSNTVIFGGEKKQTISAGAAFFEKIVLSNNSEEGIIADMLLSYSCLDTNGCRIVYGVENDLEYAVTGFTLQEDYTAKGDLYLMDGNMDLNGHTLTVEGDLIQASGDMTINGGTLIVKGSYGMQYRTGLEGNYQYKNSRGRLVMTGEKDQALVCGDFYCSTIKSMEGLLTNGTMEVRGDFRQNTAENFIATGEHTVVLGRKLDENGNAYVQTVFFEKSPGIARFHKVVLTKLYETGYVFQNDLSSISDEILYDYCDEEAPSAVTKISVVETECSSITIAYEGAVDNEKILGYEIYRDGVKIGETSAKSFKDSGLKADKEYTYQVFAFDDYRNVAKTSPECAGRTLVDEEAPEAVRGLYVKGVTGSSITIAWRKAADNVEVTDYKVYRDGKEIAATNGELLYKDTGLLEGKVHTYQVAAIDESGNESQKSEEVNAFASLPEFIRILPNNDTSIGGEETTFSIYYSSMYREDDYNLDIDYYDLNKKEWISIVHGLSNGYFIKDCYAISYKWDTTEFSQSQRLKIRFTLSDVDGNSTTKEQSYNMDRTPPMKPVGVQARDQGGTVQVSWNPSSDKDCIYYDVFRVDCETGQCEWKKKVDGINNTSFVDKDVAEGKRYEYYVQAVDYFNQGSTLSDSVFVFASKDKQAPVMKYMRVYNKVNRTASVYVSAEDNRKVSSIALYCRAEGEEVYRLLERKSYKDKELSFYWDTRKEKDGVYILKAAAVDEAGNCSETLSTKTVRCQVDNTGVSQVKNVKGTASSTEVQLTWDDLEEEDSAGFWIYKLEGEKRIPVMFQEGKIGVNVVNLKPETEYEFVVIGHDELGNEGPESEPFKIKTQKDTTAPVISYISYGIMRAGCLAQIYAIVDDNAGIDRTVFSYSRDGVNYEEIGTIQGNGNKRCKIELPWNIEDMEEGDVYLKLSVFDESGNIKESSEKELILCTIDKTAPEPVKNLCISEREGCSGLMWDKAIEEDVGKYNIYRSAVDSNMFRYLGSTNTNFYCDRMVTEGVTYHYKITVEDWAGNESDDSPIVIWTAGVDKEAPKVTGVSIKEQSILGINPQFKVIATDNFALSAINIEYRKTNSDKWQFLGEYEVEGEVCQLEEIWDTQGLSSGEYEIRISATDQRGNYSNYYQVKFTLNTDTPSAPDLKAEEIDGRVHISFSKNKEEDFCEYKLYKKEEGHDDYECIMEGTENEYFDENVKLSTKYIYYVEAYNVIGNYSISSEVSILTDAIDKQAPKVTLGDFEPIEGREMEFFPKTEWDNVKITKYVWDFGDGSRSTSRNPRHIYGSAGKYKVLLIVEDEAGNATEIQTEVEVAPKGTKGVHKLSIRDEYGNPVKDAVVILYLSDDNMPSYQTGDMGIVSITGEKGLYQVAVNAEGYSIVEGTIELDPERDTESELVLKKNLPMIGKIESKKLSLEELKDLEVDFTDARNFSTYAFIVEAKFRKKGIRTERLTISAGKSTGRGESGGSGSGNENTADISKDKGFSDFRQLNCDEPVFYYFSSMPASISWLKDMYQVQFAILNMSDEKYPIEASKAVLKLPDGLSLSKMKTEQLLQKEIGTVGGNQEKSASWVVKVDKEGEHTIKVNFQGTLQPFGTKVNQTFSGIGKYSIINGKGLHLYIYPEKTAHNLGKYYIQYQLKNESNQDCNYVTVKFGKFQTTEKVEKVYSYLNGKFQNVIENRSGITYYMPAKGSNGQLPILCKGDSLTVEALKPGQSIYGTCVGIFQGIGRGDEVYYELCEAMVKEIKSETNADLKVTVRPINGHLEKSRLRVNIHMGSYTDDLISALKNVLNNLSVSFTPKKCSGDPVNIMTGGFESSQTIMQAAGINKLDFTISYDSRNTEKKGDMGYGWYHNYESRIEECGSGIRVYWNPNSYTIFANKNAMDSIVEGIYQDGTMWLTDTLSENNVPKEEQKQTRNAISENSISGNSISENNVYNYFSQNYGQDYEQDANITSQESPDIGMDEIEEGKNIYLPTGEGMKGWRVIKTEEGYCMYASTGECFRYDMEGNLASVENQKGQKITFTRSGSCMVIADEGTDKSITAYYDENGNLTTLGDNGGNQAVFTYDGNNNLTAVKSKGGTTTTYQYDEKHRILSGRDTDGNLFVENTYDEKGRVLTQDDGDQTTELMEISYEEDEESGRTTISVKNTNGGRETVVANAFGEGLTYTDSLGAVTQWEYDAEGRVTAFREGDGNSGRIAYDENGNIISKTESGGKTTTYTYDENSRLLSQTCNDGTSLTYTYGGDNQPASITSGTGAAVRYEYNENGQVTKETVEGLGETSYQYSDGLLTQVTDSNGNVSKYLYDSIGNVVQYINGKGIVTDYEIAPNGKVLKETVTLTDGNKAVTSYAYDAYGNQTGKTDANGNTTTYTYDRNDRLIKETRADGSVITYDRDVDGNITKLTYPDGITTIEAAYDTAGNLLTLKDALKSTTVQHFNSGSQLVGTALANGGQITYSYYDNGFLKSETDAMGNTITYTYDGAGRVTGITDKMGSTTSYGYDSAGNAATVTNPAGETVTIAYNQYRQAVSTTDAKGSTTRYEYDGLGNCVRMTDALGHVTEYEYNGSNEIVKVTRKGENGHEDISLTYAHDHLGNVTSVTDGEGNTYRMDYDKAGNLKAVYDAYGTAAESYSYDKVYNQISVKDAKGNETEMSYDSLGNMVSMLNKATGSATTYAYVGGQLLSSSTDALGGKVTAEYDSMGNVKRFTNPNGGMTEYTYDLNNRVTGESIGSEYRHSYEYNANGQVIKKTNSRGQVTEYTYDKAGRLTSLTDQLGTIRYTYDKNGNVLTVTDSQGTITREYDALNRVTAYTDTRGNTIRYGYDEFGNLTELTYPNGKQVIYAYDKNGNIKTATDWEGRITTYEYDKNSRLVKTTRPDGTVETRTYDKAGQLLSILDKKGSQIINSQEYVYDVSGNITEVKASQKGEMQASGEIANTSMEYDKTNRLIKYNGKEVKYDKDGNMVYGPLNGEMAGFTYDCRNRLVQAGTTKYEYDAEDNRTAVIKNAGTKEEVRTEYVVDSVEELSRVLMAVEKKPWNGVADNSMENTTENGTIGSITVDMAASATGNEALQTTYFYYGNGLLAQENEKEGYLTYHFNNVGSTNAVTDKKGVVKYTYAYNPYGELTKGSYGQVMFLFNGQYGVASDDNGLYYMRARYYNVSIKRFINQDVVTGSIAESQSLNRYAYVEGNPVSYLDPFGLEPLLTDELHETLLFTSVIGGIVGKYSIPAGMIIGTAAVGMDVGVSINDIFTSGFDGKVTIKSLQNIKEDLVGFTLGFIGMQGGLTVTGGFVSDSFLVKDIIKLIIGVIKDL